MRPGESGKKKWLALGEGKPSWVVLAGFGSPQKSYSTDAETSVIVVIVIVVVAIPTAAVRATGTVEVGSPVGRGIEAGATTAGWAGFAR